MQTQAQWPLSWGVLSSVLVLLLAFGQTPELFAAQNPPAPQSGRLRLVIVEGGGAINNIQQRVARDVIVQVTDENDRPVAGAALGFLLPAAGPGGTFSNGLNALSLVTDSAGRAAASFTPNTVAGSYQMTVTASFQGQSATTTIAQTNALGAAGAGTAATTAAGGGGMSGATIGLVVAAAIGAVAIGVVASQGDDDPPSQQSPPIQSQPTVRIALGGGPPVFSAPGGWQSSVKPLKPAPNWRP
jgi:hypothetical protein